MTVRLWHEICPRPFFLAAWLGRRYFRVGWRSQRGKFHRPHLSTIAPGEQREWSLVIEVYGFIAYIHHSSVTRRDIGGK